MIDLNKIAQHYLEKIIVSGKYKLPSPCKDIDLLLPDFKSIVDESIYEYNQVNNDEVYILETYRSNALQLAYYHRGASQIKTNGMHHYGIAVDLCRAADGKYADYNLDYKVLRHIAQAKRLTVLNIEQAHFQLIPVFEQEHLRTIVRNEVIEFQKNHNLVPDGIVGIKTITKAKETFI
jgi:hypothetical protein